jgi:hypothetical protein
VPSLDDIYKNKLQSENKVLIGKWINDIDELLEPGELQTLSRCGSLLRFSIKEGAQQVVS